MATGGRIQILRDSAEPAVVNITGPGSFKVDGNGSPVSYPVAIVEDTNYVTPDNGRYRVEVFERGVKTYDQTVVLSNGNVLIVKPSLRLDQFIESLSPVVASKADLEDEEAPINTVGKYLGKVVFCSDDGVPVWATGPDADDDWNDATGTKAYEPTSSS